jgi:hypothetical protein
MTVVPATEAITAEAIESTASTTAASATPSMFGDENAMWSVSTPFTSFTPT